MHTTGYIDARSAYLVGDFDAALEWATRAWEDGDVEGLGLIGAVDVAAGNWAEGRSALEEAARSGSHIAAERLVWDALAPAMQDRSSNPLTWHRALTDANAWLSCISADARTLPLWTVAGYLAAFSDDTDAFLSSIPMDRDEELLSPASTEEQREFLDLVRACALMAGTAHSRTAGRWETVATERGVGADPWEPHRTWAQLLEIRGDAHGAGAMLDGIPADQRTVSDWSVLAWYALQRDDTDRYLAAMTSEHLMTVLESAGHEDPAVVDLLNNHVACMSVAGAHRSIDEERWKELVEAGNTEALLISAARAARRGDHPSVTAALDQVDPEAAEDFTATTRGTLASASLAPRAHEWFDCLLWMAEIAQGPALQERADPWHDAVTRPPTDLALLLKPVVEELSAQGRLALINDEHLLGDSQAIGDQLYNGGQGVVPADDAFGRFIQTMAEHIQYGDDAVWSSELRGSVLTRRRFLHEGEHESQTWEHFTQPVLHGDAVEELQYRWRSMPVTAAALNFPGAPLTYKGVLDVVALRQETGDPDGDYGERCGFYPGPAPSPTHEIVHSADVAPRWTSALQGLQERSRKDLAAILMRADDGPALCRALGLTVPAPHSQDHDSGVVAAARCAPPSALGPVRIPDVVRTDLAFWLITDMDFSTAHLSETEEAQFLADGEMEYLLDRHYGLMVARAASRGEVALDPMLDGLVTDQWQRLRSVLIVEAPDIDTDGGVAIRDDYTGDIRRRLRHLAAESWRQPLPSRYATAMATLMSIDRDELIAGFYASPTTSLESWWSVLSARAEAGNSIDAGLDTPSIDDLRAWIAANPWTPPAVLSEAARSALPWMRRRAAMNSLCAPEDLDVLALDTDPQVRLHVWRHPEATDEARAAAQIGGTKSVN